MMCPSCQHENPSGARFCNGCGASLELNPSFAAAYWGLCLALMYTNRPDEAVEMIQKAVRLSPQDPLMHFFLFDLARLHFLAGRYQEAAESAKRSLHLRPGQAGCFRIIAAIYGHLGQLKEARAALDAALQLEPGLSSRRLQSTVPPAHVERLMDGLRKAGLRN